MANKNATAEPEDILDIIGEDGMVHLDFTGVSSDGFEPLPAGAYPVQIGLVETKFGKESGKPYLNWTFTITDGDHTGRKIFSITSLSAKALFSLKQLLEACGEEVPDGPLKFNPEEMLGRTLTIELTTENYKDDAGNVKVQNRVKKYLA